MFRGACLTIGISAAIVGCGKPYLCSSEARAGCEEACEKANAARSCTRAGVLADQEHPGSGLQWFVRGCALADERACFLAGTQVLNSTATDDRTSQIRRLSQSLRLFRRACDLKDADGCTFAAALAFDSTNPNPTLGAYKDACEQGSGLGCYLAGESFVEGWGVTEWQIARGYFERGCHARLSSTEACTRLRTSVSEPGTPKPADDAGVH